jgi:hypothetical protein
LFLFSPKKGKDRLSKSEAFGRSRRLLALEASCPFFGEKRKRLRLG